MSKLFPYKIVCKKLPSTKWGKSKFLASFPCLEDSRYGNLQAFADSEAEAKKVLIELYFDFKKNNLI